MEQFIILITLKLAHSIFMSEILSSISIYLQILCGYGLRWVAASHGMIPQGAIPVGYCLSGDTLFIGRTHLLGSLTPGKVSRLHRCLYVPFNGREYATPVYEVLVCYPSIHLNYKSSCSIQ